MNNTLVFLDEGFLEKLNKHFGKGKYIKFNKVIFSNNLAKILYTYYDKKRNTNFSRSNELIKSVYKYVLLNIGDFGNNISSKSNKK